MKKTLSIVLLVLLVFLAVACSPEHQHDYKLVESKSVPASCESNGYNYMECSCGAIQSIPTAALGHDYVEDKDQYVASTCRTKGRKVSVCSKCDEAKEVTLPLDVNNHPFAEVVKDEDGKATKEYVGVYEHSKDITTWPTCANDGEGVFTECTACGKTGEFTVVIPSADALKIGSETYPSGHVKVAADGKSVVEIGAEDVIKWKITKEATAFVTGLKTAYCPTCGKLVETDSEATDLIDETIPVEKDDVLGFYSLKTAAAEADKNYDLYTISASKKNGSYNFDVYEMDVTEQKVYSTGNEKIVGVYSAAAASGTNLYDEAMYWTLTGSDGLSGTTIILTEVTSIETTSKDKLGNTLAVGDIIAKVNSSDVYKLASPSDHEHNFTLMKDERAISIVGVVKGHYLECADCGLKYVFEGHASGCEVCGWTDKWYKVNIGTTGTASTIPTDGDIFYVEKWPTYKLASSGEYRFFLGGTKEYNELLALNDSSTYYTTSNSDGSFTLATGKTSSEAMGIGLNKK